jgi:hypothetical protein
MSTLSMRLKQRVRMLAAGAVLSTTTLALLPGVAEEGIGGGILLVAMRRRRWLNS